MIHSLFDAKGLSAAAEVTTSSRDLRQLGQYSEKKSGEAAKPGEADAGQYVGTDAELVEDMEKDPASVFMQDH